MHFLTTRLYLAGKHSLAARSPSLPHSMAELTARAAHVWGEADLVTHEQVDSVNLRILESRH